MAHGFLRLRCGECGHDTLLASLPELVTRYWTWCNACSSVTCGMRRGLSAAKARVVL